MRLGTCKGKLCISHDYYVTEAGNVFTIIEYENGQNEVVPINEVKMNDTKRLINQILEDITCDHECGCDHACNQCIYNENRR